ncbi:MAG: RNA pseudouridine synthase [Planctomycetes bacterium]|nr:RNA pseudouridine synthase [Planctomycetota bacterium]
MSSDLPEFDPESVLFQGSGLLAVNKPAGIPVHAGTGHPFGLAEMIDAFVKMNPGLLEISPSRPVLPIHRLDLEASGVLLFGLTPELARLAHEAFEARRVSKRYLAVVSGPVKGEETIRGKVRAKGRDGYRWEKSSLDYRRLEGDERLSLVEVVPHEGRTHQIRALFAGLDRPLAGDTRYGKPKPARQFLEKFGVPGLLLHALELTLPPEVLGRERKIQAPLPENFLKVMRQKGWTKISGCP